MVKKLIMCYDHNIHKYKKQLPKIEKKVGMEFQKSIQTRVVRMVTKVKGRPYFFVSEVSLVFGCLFARHLKFD